MHVLDRVQKLAMRSLHCLAQILLNLFGTGYAVALLALLLLRFLGRDHRWWIAALVNFMPFYFVPLFGIAVLALMARAHLAVIATAPLVLAGCVLYGPLFLAKSAEAVSGNSLTIVTFNVSGNNQHLDKVLAWLRKQHADVVFLQEVSEAWFAPIRQTLSDLYPEQVEQLTPEGYSGNLTLSRFPRLDASTQTSHAFEPVILDVHGQPVAFYNIHLATPVGVPPYWELSFGYPYLELARRYNDEIRNRQIEQLLEQVRAQTLAYVVAGDFNTSDQTSMYTSLAALMGDSFRESGVGLGMSWPAFEGAGLPFLPALMRIDYIWHSRGFSALKTIVGPYLGSDHLPIEAVLVLTPRIGR